MDRTSKNTKSAISGLVPRVQCVQDGLHGADREIKRHVRRRRRDEDEDASEHNGNATVVDDDDQSLVDRRALLNRISMIASVRNPEAV